ncbi:GNAT family N-acetyltransferase [Paenibacillus sp. IB182496]|uniref:GNAT family N-acetyltransferase n=2 Tax=Paenibacillus sabuli TaxID=2772509 RepID=A0A927BRL6_9BACL|nr:GNAT family N-acetyltransferase [Paenibacillus sabuli]
MMLVPLSVFHARQICDWRYPSPYERFNWPAWADMVRSGSDFGDRRVRRRQFAAIVDPWGGLLGFAQFFPLVGVLRLGLGLHPELCSRGLGARFVRLIADEARRRAPGEQIDLEVLTWNTRAIRAYERAGFCITDTYERDSTHGRAQFHCMVYLPEHGPGQPPLEA